MSLSSLLFIFLFLPIALILYYITPKKAKNIMLLLISLIFYAWGDWRYFPIMLATVLVNYFAALGMAKFEDNQRRRLLFAAALTLTIGFLVVFKYLDFFTNQFNALFSIRIPLLNLSLPLGISFYTFQTLSYTIDVYRRKIPAERNFIIVAAFITMFPQIGSGPIIRYAEIEAELKDRKITAAILDEGMEDFVIGLASKILIADNVGMLWAEAQKLGFDSLSTGMAWLSLLAFALQIYFDFAGYTRMAIGLGKMLGFRYPKNFDTPYSSRSVTEFWRRWHMSLGRWFKEYIYIPLGGSRQGYWRTIFNLLIVWACTGLWHGASWNFVLWGLYFFALLWIEKSGFLGFLNSHKIFSHIYALLAIMLGWALFAITDLSALLTFLQRLFVPTSLTGGAPINGLYYLRNYAAVLVIGCWFSTQKSADLYQKLRERRFLRNLILIALFLLSIAYLVDSTYSPSLYAQF